MHRRSEYVRGPGPTTTTGRGGDQEPITKIIDKLKWFVEHKGRKTSEKLQGSFEGEEGVDAPQVRDKASSSEVRDRPQNTSNS